MACRADAQHRFSTLYIILYHIHLLRLKCNAPYKDYCKICILKCLKIFKIMPARAYRAPSPDPLPSIQPPASALSALAEGGNSAIGYVTAIVLVAAYGLGAFLLAATALARRDITA